MSIDRVDPKLQPKKVPQDVMDDSIIFALAGAMVDIYCYGMMRNQKGISDIMTHVVPQLVKMEPGFIARFRDARERLKEQTQTVQMKNILAP